VLFCFGLPTSLLSCMFLTKMMMARIIMTMLVITARSELLKVLFLVLSACDFFVYV